jgi:hypothetical protein
VAGWEDVDRHALALPETSVIVKRAGRHWEVRGKGFVWERPLRRKELDGLGDDAPDGPILGALVENLHAKESLLAQGAPFFTTPHFDGYPAVLIMLDDIGVDALGDVIVEAWLARAPKRLAAAFIRSSAGPE